MHRVIVCGGRHYDDQERVFTILDNWLRYYEDRIHIIQGGATGADYFAESWARTRHMPCTTFHANWPAYGKAAGIIRNTEMLEYMLPDVVIAFPGGKGTANMVEVAKQNGTPVHEYE